MLTEQTKQEIREKVKQIRIALKKRKENHRKNGTPYSQKNEPKDEEIRKFLRNVVED